MKPELVLLHGWGFNSTVWKNFLPYLEKQFSVTALDLLEQESLTLNSITSYILKNSPDKAVFLGWSLGGLIAMNIAIHNPDRITKLITIASTPKFIETEDWPGMPSKLLNQFYDALKIDYRSTLQQFVLLQFYGSNTDHAIIKNLKNQVINGPTPPAQSLEDALHIIKEVDFRNDLKKIECPQLYLFGRCDTLVPADAAEAIKQLATNATMEVLPKVSHAPFLSNPKLCAEKIGAFLS